MPSGLRFCNVDLHVHTPASECFTEEDVTPEMLVDQAIQAGMQAIAITDHNTADWVDRVKSAAEGKALVVFPGVEITVQPGVHVLAIFSEKCNGAQVTDLLAELGLHHEERGNPESLVTRSSVQEVISIIRNRYHALPILAHIDAPKGAWLVLRNSGQTLLQLWQKAEFAAVEITGQTLPAEIGQDPFWRRPAFYWSSDNPNPKEANKHSHLGIGNRYSRFELGDPINWEGLRLCFHDPGTRIRPAGNKTCNHPTIESIKIEGGFLSDLDLELNPNLNCLIGGRGTGKSSLIELVRFAFEIEPKTDSNLKQAKGILENTFKPGSRVQVNIRLEDGSGYRVERAVQQPPRVFRIYEEDPIGVRPSDLMPIQIYGQKEVYEISQDPAFQLRLLDNYLVEALRPLQKQENEILRLLRENAADILETKEYIHASLESLEKLDGILEELHRMEKQDFVSRLRQKQCFDLEKRWLDLANARVEDVTAAVGNFLAQQHFKIQEVDERLPNHEMLERQKELLQKIENDLEQSLTELRKRILENWAEGQDERFGWQKEYEAQEAVYRQLLLEFQDSGRALSPDRFIQLQHQRQELEELQTRTDEKKNYLASLWNTRRGLLVDLRRIHRAQYETRRDKAKELTTELNGTVRVTIYPQGHREAYEKFLDELFHGCSVRAGAIKHIATAEAEQPEQQAQRPVNVRGEIQYLVPRIPRYLDPIDLADAIRLEQQPGPIEESLLERDFHIESDPMRKNITRLSQECLFELEMYSAPDLPVIELHVGSGDLGYKPLSALSIGQRCTALLSLVLLESPAPLLIDQPEDDLDNHFIFDQIVATLRSAKERRQFFIATHNANIPVSGDAELIIVLNADEKRGWVEPNGIGSIDTPEIKEYVEKILEGGETAFKIRKEKYGIL